jgi:hypothetical protein
LRSELARRLESDADLRAGGHDRQVLGFLFMQDVAALGRFLDSRVLEIWQILSRKGEDRRGLGRPERDEIGGRGLVAICRTPERKIRNRTEMDCRLDGLVCGAILTKTDRIVSRCAGRQWPPTSSSRENIHAPTQITRCLERAARRTAPAA